MKLLNTLTTLFLVTLLGACAHHNNVRPAADGEHYIKLMSETKSDAGKEAIDQAEHYCAEQELQAYVVKETIEYVGTISEEQYLATRNIANAVQTAGTTMWAFGQGQGKVDDAGAIMALSGGAVQNSMGQPYELEMTFTCR